MLLILLTLLHITNATIKYVTTNNDDHDNQQVNTSAFHTLQYYINNVDKYLDSHTYLYFLPGQHHLNTDFVINSTTNFTIAGNDSTIVCTPPAGIRVVNVTNFKLMNINLFDCGNSNYHYLYTHSNKFIPTELIKCNASVLLDHCASVVIKSVSISINVGYVGVFVLNVRNISNITDLKVYFNCSVCPKLYSHISGLMLCYSKINNTGNNSQKRDAIINLINYHYKTYGSCPYHFQYAITLLLFQKHYNVSVNIQRMAFGYLENASLLYYSGDASESNVVNRVTFDDSVIHNNTGNDQLKMVHIVLNNYRKIVNDLSILQFNQQRSMIEFENCTFANNANMEAMVYLMPASSRIVAGYIKMRNVTFCSNSKVHFIKVKSTIEIIWQLTTHIELSNVNILSNMHTDGENLISVTNGVMYFVSSVKFINNSYYSNLVALHLSVAVVVSKTYAEFTSNTARQILNAKSSSYFMMEESTIVNMSANTVYVVVKQARTFRDDSRPVCLVQFHNNGEICDKNLSSCITTLYKILMLKNILMVSKHLPDEDMSFGNCTWLAGTAFYEKPAQSVFEKVLNTTHILMNKTTKRLIPLSICPCINLSVYDCYSADLGSLFPGQTLTIKLLVKEKWLSQYNPSTALTVDNTPDDNCTVVDSHQLSQAHFSHGCNTYQYTIWPSNKRVNECKLYLSVNEMSEMFFIEINPCPKGFTLNMDRKVCYCDPLLNNNVLSITSCDLNDQTILRPANSWITADTVNGSHTYLVSSSCPFHYCLPYSSHHNLSDPDSQCQYNRSGVLCGQCKQGLSSVFGSSQCKHCSDLYLLLIIPILTVGVVLVIMLFAFHVTVTNGIINSFIFYFNIISINYAIFFPGCQHIICPIVMFINLDIGTETCFYNGMDDYAIAWLLLTFPTYLIVIALILIVMSRYSSTIQRVTAKKALPVLATLFMLSYTKMLQNVCNVLFQYFAITQIPSNHTKLVWSISTTTPLFGLKFSVIYIVCIILFLILLSFNVILLITRKLFQFKLISNLKPLLDVYFAPYKDNTFYWTGLMLLARTIIFALSAFNEYISLIMISVLLGGLLWWHGVAKPFRSKFENFQESALILNLLVVHVIPLYKINDSGLKIAQIIIALAVGYFALVLLFYCCLFRFRNSIQASMKNFYDKIYRMKDRTSGNNQDTVAVEMEEFRSRIPEVAYNCKEFREPLVGFEY